MKGIVRAPRSHVGLDGSLLVVDWPGLPPIFFDSCMLDRITSRDSDLMLAVDDVEAAMHIADGRRVAEQIAVGLAPYTRDSPITQADVLDDAHRRLRARDNARERKETDYAIVVSSAAAVVNNGGVSIGVSHFTIAQIEEQAYEGGTLMLVGGGRLQAALLLLVIAAEQRAGGREDFARLEQRVAAYESRLLS